MLETLLTPEEVADNLHISVKTLRGLKDRRLIRYVQVSPRRWGCRPQDVEEFKQRNLKGGDGEMVGSTLNVTRRRTPAASGIKLRGLADILASESKKPR